MEILLSLPLILIQGFEIPGTGIILDLPGFGGWFSNGIFSAIGFALSIFLAFMIVVWVGLALYGAFSIISSLGDTQKIEKGWKTIKSIWIGISYFMIFFMIISLLAVFVGIGAPWEWAENLQQCPQGGPAAGRFYFQGQYEGNPLHPEGFVRKSFQELLRDYRKAHPNLKKAYVLCCDDGDKEYIRLTGVNADVFNCKINSEHTL